MNRISLSQSFDEVASLYNEVRPRYPDALFSALIDITGVSPASRILEIGAGTGQATEPLAKRGFNITAIEPGNSLASLAKSQLQQYQNTVIVNATFEAAVLPPGSFDLVYAATSFHWLDPVARFLKTHEVLKDHSFLAIIHTNHVSDEQGDRFFIDSQPIYDRYGFTDKNEKPRLSRIQELKPDEINDDLFRLISFHCFPTVVKYSARNYASLLNTYSNHLSASKHVQQSFYRDIENLIEDDFSGQIDKHFAMSLTIAQKK
jgi:ubiquinone/menaquinone biosynthesis C-methylase UbiE